MNASVQKQDRGDRDWVVQQVRSAACRHLGIDLRNVQVTAASSLLGRCIAEMQTGEGKTLTTALSACMLAMSGRRVLIATANDYLAWRDSHWMGPIYRELGLRVEGITSETSDHERRSAYGCDITYAPLREFAFDFLRDALAGRQDSRPAAASPFPLDVLIVDEADSVLIDEARTPMIITAPNRKLDAATETCYRWSTQHAADYRRDQDYVRLADTGAIALTQRGRRRAMHAEMPRAMASLTTTEILHALERALWVNETIQRDQQYLVRDGRIHLVDEYTGRKSGDRNFGGGIHQAIEAREGLNLTAQSEVIARISVQDFVARFDHLCGLTATAWEDRREFHSVYGLAVRRVATHRPSRRVVWKPIVCRSGQQKWQRIMAETRSLIDDQRAVLIGTRTVAQSEQLSELFGRSGIDHVVLNARNPRREAAIVAEAGHRGRITIATNMAGRGTDIRLAPEVARAGGLHVIVSEPHAAARIDRQLIGRSGRQGDAGSARVYASPDDEILSQAFGHQQADRIRTSAATSGGNRRLLAKLRQAQTRISRIHRLERARLTAQESSLADSMRRLGLDPHLDPLPQLP